MAEYNQPQDPFGIPAGEPSTQQERVPIRISPLEIARLARRVGTEGASNIESLARGAAAIKGYMTPQEIREVVEKYSKMKKMASGGTVSSLQKHAGNYKKHHVNLHGLNISIENKAGSTRSGTSDTGKQWQSKMHHDYGYIRGTQGADKDHIDVFVNKSVQPTGPVVVINQHNRNGSFDEHKVMLGFPNRRAAIEAYHSNYDKNWKGFGSATVMTLDQFKKWAFDGARRKPVTSRQLIDPVRQEKMNRMEAIA